MAYLGLVHDGNVGLRQVCEQLAVLAHLHEVGFLPTHTHTHRGICMGEVGHTTEATMQTHLMAQLSVLSLGLATSRRYIAIIVSL